MKKKINKKGFTLVELLAVVVILLAISVIAISSISAAIERQNIKKEDSAIKFLLSSAELYVDEHKNEYAAANTKCLPVSELISDLNLDEEALKDRNGAVLSGSVHVKYDAATKKFDINYPTDDCK